MTARKPLVQERIPGGARLRIRDPAGQRRRVANHRRQSVLTECLGELERRLHEHDRARVKGDMVADDVEQRLGSTGLGTLHAPGLADGGVVYRVHDRAQVRRVVRHPSPRRCAALATQPSFGVGPLADQQLRRRPEDRQQIPQRRSRVLPRKRPGQSQRARTELLCALAR
jgi:hypothetical protein